jgi:hypothetical protein
MKVCENNDKKNCNKTIKTCVDDIADFFLKHYEGADGLYHLLIEKIVEEVENIGVVDENMLFAAKNMLGEKLYSK